VGAVRHCYPTLTATVTDAPVSPSDEPLIPCVYPCTCVRACMQTREPACSPFVLFLRTRTDTTRGPGSGGLEVKRRETRSAPSQPDTVRSMGVDCCGDGYRHQVPVEVASRELARDGRVLARCGHLVIAAALADLPRPACPLCYPSTPDI